MRQMNMRGRSCQSWKRGHGVETILPPTFLSSHLALNSPRRLPLPLHLSPLPLQPVYRVPASSSPLPSPLSQFQPSFSRLLLFPFSTKPTSVAALSSGLPTVPLTRVLCTCVFSDKAESIVDDLPSDEYPCPCELVDSEEERVMEAMGDGYLDDPDYKQWDADGLGWKSGCWPAEER